MVNDIETMYDPQQFREIGHAVIDLLAEYLEKSLSGKGPVLDWSPPADSACLWQQPLPQQPTLSLQAFPEHLQVMLFAHSLHIHHPRNLGHQVAPPLPNAALCDLVASFINQPMAIFEAGPAATLMERQVVRWLGLLIGWQDTEGVLTSGGAQANLTALLAARQKMAGWDVWKSGMQVGAPLRILTSEHAHYSVARAGGIMGLGTESVVKVATDSLGCMSVPALREAHKRVVASGARIMAVVATAGCTPTGSIDPMADIGSYCRENGLWLHVDGAHGASGLLSSRHREALRGIELADSVVWDGHKLLYMPATVSAVLYRNPETSYAAYAQEASYLFSGQRNEEDAYNLGIRTLECTKRMMGLKLWAAFSLYGTEGLASLVDRVYATANLLAKKLEAAADFELLMPPQTNIVCFRKRSGDQAAIRKTLVENGDFHLTQVDLHGTIWLRTAVMNPLTKDSDLEALLEGIRKARN